MELLHFAVCLLAAHVATTGGSGVPEAEQEAAYLALNSINAAVDWRALYPDDICLSGPHGVVCDFFVDAGGGLTPHITELNFGYVSDYNSNPDCGVNATLPPILSSSAFPFLRRLFFYRCFRFAQTPLSAGFWNISPSLEELLFHDNPSLVGRLSHRIAGLPRLRRFVISNTGICGDVPPEIGRLQNLELLVLSRNRLRGSIPSGAGDLARLKILDLSGNRLVGFLPREIGRLTGLLKLDLSSNRFTGPVPSDISRLKRLEFLDLSLNLLTGGIPTALAEMRNLKEVYLSGNPLGGQIPEIWENLGGILGLGLSGMRLTGSIPPSMGLHLQNVCYLSLEGNSLIGEIPEQLTLLEQSAKEINMENNVLRGRIPFSAGFVEAIGGKLKLAGNPNLCVADDVAVHLRNKGILSYLRVCNKTHIPLHAPFSLPCSSVGKAASTFSVLFLLVFRLIQV